MDKNVALIVKQQCIGGYAGHMAHIPFNPTIEAIFSLLMKQYYDPKTTEDQRFALVLRKLADALDPKESP